MKYIQTIDFKRPKDYHPLSLRFYSHKGKYFRDFLILTPEEGIEAMENKTTLFSSLEECEADFHEVAQRQDAEIISKYQEN